MKYDQMSSFAVVLLFSSAALLAIGAGCGSSKSSSSPAPAPATPAALTTSFTGTCGISGCHGSDGAGTPTGAATGRGVLKGTALTEAVFLGYVRNGISGTAMVPYGASVISDADVQTDYTVLTTK